MIRTRRAMISPIIAIAVLAMAPAAHADDAVTYEVTSDFVPAANVEYSDLSGRNALEGVPLPWRVNATVANPHSSDAQLHADWGQYAGRYKWVTVRIYTHGSLLCEMTVDENPVACNGSGFYKSWPPSPQYEWPLPTT